MNFFSAVVQGCPFSETPSEISYRNFSMHFSLKLLPKFLMKKIVPEIAPEVLIGSPGIPSENFPGIPSELLSGIVQFLEELPKKKP